MSKTVMLRFMAFVIILVLGVGAARARTYVLVTGVSNYNEPGVNDLPQATKDAKSMAALFKRKYPDTSLLTTKYANRNNILQLTRKIAGQAGANDRIIFFYSGHGGNGFMYITDGMLKYSELLKVLSSSRCRNILVILDTCHSGSVLTAMQQLKRSGKYRNNILVMASSRNNEISRESPFLEAGLLTRGLLKGMRGKADADGNRIVTVEELFRYAYNDVTAHTRSEQHPQLIGATRLRSMPVIQW